MSVTFLCDVLTPAAGGWPGAGGESEGCCNLGGAVAVLVFPDHRRYRPLLHQDTPRGEDGDTSCNGNRYVLRVCNTYIGILQWDVMSRAYKGWEIMSRAVSDNITIKSHPTLAAVCKFQRSRNVNQSSDVCVTGIQLVAVHVRSLLHLLRSGPHTTGSPQLCRETRSSWLPVPGTGV